MSKPNADTKDKRISIVKDILVKEIISDKKAQEIHLEKQNGKTVIISPQTYGTGKKLYRAADPDMSDLSIKFYETIYKDNLLKHRQILDMETKLFETNDIAGDTMFTIRSLRRIAAYRDFINEQLEDFDSTMHCLANFWIIPMLHGRRSTKRNYYDSPDMYIDLVRENLDEFGITFPDYFNGITVEAFQIYHHFIPSEERMAQISDRSFDIVESYKNAIDARATDIAIAHTDALYSLFNGYNLLQ